MKKKFTGLAVTVVACSAIQLSNADTASATSLEDQFSAHGVLTLSSDYRSRGFSKSNHKASVQGGITLVHQSGAYLMLWGASATTPNGGSMEADVIAGYTWHIDDKNSLDFFYADVNYPGGTGFTPSGDSADFGEYGILYNRKDTLTENGNLSLGLYYSPDYVFGSGNQYYISGEYGFPISSNVQLFGSVGYTKQDSVEEFQIGTAFDADQDDYFDYKIGVRGNYMGLTTELAWVDNNIDSQQEMYDERLYLSVTKHF